MKITAAGIERVLDAIYPWRGLLLGGVVVLVLLGLLASGVLSWAQAVEWLSKMFAKVAT